MDNPAAAGDLRSRFFKLEEITDELDERTHGAKQAAGVDAFRSFCTRFKGNPATMGPVDAAELVASAKRIAAAY